MSNPPKRRHNHTSSSLYSCLAVVYGIRLARPSPAAARLPHWPRRTSCGNARVPRRTASPSPKMAFSPPAVIPFPWLPTQQWPQPSSAPTEKQHRCSYESLHRCNCQPSCCKHKQSIQVPSNPGSWHTSIPSTDKLMDSIMNYCHLLLWVPGGLMLPSINPRRWGPHLKSVV